MGNLHHSISIGQVRCGFETYEVHHYSPFARCVNCGSIAFHNRDHARNFLTSLPANTCDAARPWRHILARECPEYRHQVCNYNDYQVLDIVARLLADKKFVLRQVRMVEFLDEAAQKITKLSAPFEGDVKKIVSVYKVKLDEMTKQGMRHGESWRKNNTCARFVPGCKYLDCAGQVDEILPDLENIKGLDDQWTFEPASNIDIKPRFVPGHNWIRATPKNPKNPMLWFDPLHGTWGEGECIDCYPWSTPLWRR